MQQDVDVGPWKEPYGAVTSKLLACHERSLGGVLRNGIDLRHSVYELKEAAFARVERTET